MQRDSYVSAKRTYKFTPTNNVKTMINYQHYARIFFVFRAMLRSSLTVFILVAAGVLLLPIGTSVLVRAQASPSPEEVSRVIAEVTKVLSSGVRLSPDGRWVVYAI